MAEFGRKNRAESDEITFVPLPLCPACNFSCNKVAGKCV
jgi:hypothetical protein